jgi:hypothetical protein
MDVAVFLQFECPCHTDTVDVLPLLRRNCELNLGKGKVGWGSGVFNTSYGYFEPRAFVRERVVVSLFTDNQQHQTGH